MIKYWLLRATYLFVGLALMFLILGLLMIFQSQSEFTVSDAPPPKTALPRHGFLMPQEAYDAIGEPLLKLQFAPMSQQLPDLKRYLVYYGKNGRPDVQAEKTLMHFAFSGNKSISSVIPGERLYILYDRKLSPPQYVFSPSNRETSLWIEASSEGNEAIVHVAMIGENGELITLPETNAEFRLPEKEVTRLGSTAPWEIGGQKVDATLLARQKTRWYGPDQFLERHGGKEFAYAVGKQRLDFGEGEEIYSAFVSQNDALVWNQGRWNVVKPGIDSLGKPLLVIKKIEERLMNLELWDPDGKGKIILNLLKSSEPPPQPNIMQQFKFVGARTRSQFVFEVNKDRMLLSPHDWMLLGKEGWMKLDAPQDIDSYVERRLSGPLFIFDEVENREGKQFLRATLFNAARTEKLEIEIPLQKPTGKLPSQELKKQPGKSSAMNKEEKDQVHNFDEDDDGDDFDIDKDYDYYDEE